MKPVAVRRRDLLWLLVPLVCGAVMLLRGMDDTALTAEIAVDGTMVAAYALTDKAQTVSLPEAPGVTIEIRNRTVAVHSSDCPDKRCVRAGTISRAGEMLICLPNRLVITLTGSEQEADVMTG